MRSSRSTRSRLGRLAATLAVASLLATPAAVLSGTRPVAALTSRSLGAPYSSSTTTTSKTCTPATPATTTCAVSAAADRFAGTLRAAAAVAKGASPDGGVAATAQADITAVDRLATKAVSATYAVTFDVEEASAMATAVAGRAAASVAASITATGSCAGNQTCSRWTTNTLAPLPPTSGSLTMTLTLHAADGSLLDAADVTLRISLAAAAAATGATTATVDPPPLIRPCGGPVQYLTFCEWDILPSYSSTTNNTGYRATAEAVGAATITAITATYDRRPLATLVQATPIDSAIELDWDAAVSPLPVTAYRVYRETGPVWGVVGATAIADVPGTARSFVDSTATNGVSYRYSVAAVNADGEGPPGASYYPSFVTAMGRPATPSTPAAEPVTCPRATTPGPDRETDAGAIVQWHATPDIGRPVDSFVIHRGTSPDTTEPVIRVPAESINGTLASATDCTVPSAGTYYFNITAENLMGSSAPSATVAVAVPDVADPTGARPKAPQNASATASPTTIAVTWSPPPPDVTPVIRYHVYRHWYDGYESRQATLSADETTWTDDYYLSPGETRSYVVRAENLNGEGDPSPVVSATTPTTVPSAVPYFYGNGGAGQQHNKVQLYWGSAADGGTPITAYRIYRGTSAATTALFKTLSSSASSYLDGAVTRGSAYYYRITAVNANGEGPSSPTISVTA